jgi:hypothetical protein
LRTWYRWESGQSRPPVDVLETLQLLNPGIDAQPWTSQRLRRLIHAIPDLHNPLHTQLKTSRQTVANWLAGRSAPSKKYLADLARLEKYYLLGGREAFLAQSHNQPL